MIRILRMRDNTAKDVNFGKLLKPFEDAGLVDVFDHTPESEIELVCDICRDSRSYVHYHFDHILNNVRSSDSPSTLFKAIHNHSERIPMLISYRINKDNQRCDIRAIKNGYEMQSLLRVAAARGYVNDNDNSLGMAK